MQPLASEGSPPTPPRSHAREPPPYVVTGVQAALEGAWPLSQGRGMGGGSQGAPQTCSG